MRLELRCRCKHGYGTHAIRPFGATARPFECRSKGCWCVLYERPVPS